MSRVSVISVPKLSLGASNSQWKFPPDLESEICSLAAYCQVKKHQRTPLDSSDQLNEEDLDESDDEGCSDLPVLSPAAGEFEQKKDLLDRLAELLCYRKDPSLITSTGMIYSETEVVIIAARNTTSRSEQIWSKKDIDLLEYLAELLERVSKDDVFDSHPQPELWRTLVEYYRERIRYHAKELALAEGGSTGVGLFGERGCGAVLSGRLTEEDFAKTVDKICYSTDFYSTIKTKLEDNKFRSVLDELGFILRPKRASCAFLNAAQQLSGFQKVRFILLEGFSPRKVKSLPLPKEAFPVTSSMECKFHKMTKKQKYIHAEIVLTIYLLARDRSRTNLFPYLGVSKKTCLLCGHFLRCIGGIETRGNHGKCYSQWTLPQSLSLDTEMSKTLTKAAQSLKDIIRSEGEMAKVPHRDAEKESVMAMPISHSYEKKTTIFNRIVEDPRIVARENEWLAQCQNERRNASRSTSQSRTSVSTIGTEDGTITPNMIYEDVQKSENKVNIPETCTFCKTLLSTVARCKRCNYAAYCSRDCRQSDWYRHKFSCRLNRNIDATDYLVLACHEYNFNVPEDAVNKFGFRYFSTGQDRWRLFNLYHRLIVQCKIDEDELRNAVQQRCLREMLMRRCSQLQDTAMLQDLKWLDGEIGFGAYAEGPGIVVLLENARQDLLNPAERSIPFNELQPREKTDALVFWSQIRNGFKPDVDEDNWISLGFCTAPNAKDEQQIASAYGQLVKNCQFEEFWKAMANSSMIELFEKYGLADTVLDLRNFTNLMTRVRKMRQSVWYLKRFVRLADTEPFRAVVVDYGFHNCNTARQRMQLRELYKRYFDQAEDEMKLHESCIAGTLWEFISSILGELSVPPELLRSPYPLENFPLMGMVADKVVMCTESALSQAEATGIDEGTELIVIPDSDDEEMQRFIQERSEFIGIGPRKRYYSTPDGKSLKELSLW